MFCFQSRMTGLAFAVLCGFTLIFTQTALANGHVASSAELQAVLKANAGQRQANVASVQEFLGSELGQKALKASGFDQRSVTAKVAALSDEELAGLASRTVGLQEDFSAGRLSNTHITYIIIAAVAIVLIIALAAD